MLSQYWQNVLEGIIFIIVEIFGRWKASLMAATVVLLVVLVGVVTRFRKMPKALLIRNGKLRNLAHIREITPVRSTVLDFSS